MIEGAQSGMACSKFKEMSYRMSKELRITEHNHISRVDDNRRHALEYIPDIHQIKADIIFKHAEYSERELKCRIPRKAIDIKEKSRVKKSVMILHCN